MDARIRDFIQRTKRTIGFPFKLGRQKSTLTSSSGCSGSKFHSGRLAESSVALRRSEDSGGSVPILEDGTPVRPQLPPIVQDVSEPSQSFENAIEGLQGGVRFTDSPSRIVVHSDGCYALLLNEGLVEKQRDILKYCRKRTHLKRKLRVVKMEVRDTEGKINDKKESIEETSNDKTLKSLEQDLELDQQKLLSVCQKRDMLQHDLHILEMNLEYLRNQSQELFEEVLCEAGMLNFPEHDDDSIASIQNPVEKDQRSVATSVQSSSTGISMEHTFRLALVEELKRKAEAFYFMRDGFDQRYEDLGKELEEYEQAVQDGTCDLQRSEFDCMGVKMLQARTGDYIDAEIAYEEVKTRARALGLLDNEFDQESNFIDDPDDGYRESFEAGMVATVPVAFIERWKAEIINSQEMESLDGEQLEADDWEAKTIGFSDSVSLVDCTKNGARIDRWQEICRRTREGEREEDAESPSLSSPSAESSANM